MNHTVSVYCRKLGRLTSCYERVFTRDCGVTAGRLVAGLMKLAFADPHYQRYRYRPDCRLHARRRPVVPTASPDSADRQRCRGKSTARQHHATAVAIAAVVASTLALVSFSWGFVIQLAETTSRRPVSTQGEGRIGWLRQGDRNFCPVWGQTHSPEFFKI